MNSQEYHDALYRERCRREAVGNENRRLKNAMRVIAEMPVKEQDDMLSANMRKVARDALKTPNARLTAPDTAQR